MLMIFLAGRDLRLTFFFGRDTSRAVNLLF